jgi:adenosine 3'-phospho 5'-phosphosulfate transporter B3
MLVGVLLDARAARLGQVVKRKNYGVYEYGSALLLSAGAAGFCMNANNSETDSEKIDVPDDSSSSMIGGHIMGLLLLTASVFCDAIVPNIQEKLMNGTTHTSQPNIPQNNQTDIETKSLIRNENNMQPISSNTQKGLSSLSLMVNTNAIGFTMLLLTTILSASIMTIISNILKHPHYFLLLVTVGVGLSSAVLAYTELIRRSGPAVAVAVATLRKVVTVVLSYIIFPKAMSWTHVVSSGLVLLGLLVGFVGRGRK